MKSREVTSRNLPRYWLAMSDAAAFTLVQSVLAFCTELCRDIATQVEVAPKMHAAEIAELLLSAADNGWSKSKARSMISDIVDDRDLEPEKMAKLCLLLHALVKRLPPTAWPADKRQARREFLDELRQLALQDGVAPSHISRAERREQELYRSARELKK